ncbi:MAG: hypothetical protein IJP30_04285 [Clostridia bacterium]|nr:hypothetical protein [Clostridia bacterium]
MAGIVISKSSELVNSLYGKSQEPIFALIQDQVEAFEKERSALSDIYVMEKTDKYAEKFITETSLPNFTPVGEAGAYPHNEFREGYSKVIEPDTWKNSFEVTMEMVEDANIGKIKQRAGAFTLSYNRTRELFGAQMLMGGLNSNTAITNGGVTKNYSTACADGQPMFSTAHPQLMGSDTQSNLFSSAFSYDALCYMQEAMQNYTDDDGHLLGVSPDTIIIPNDAMLKKAVFSAIGAEGLPDTANHSMNFQCGLWNVIIWPYLNRFIPANAQSKPWLLMDSEFNKAYYGAVWLDRVPLSVRSEIAPNDNNIFKGRARYAAGFNNWRPFAMSFEGSGGTVLGE